MCYRFSLLLLEPGEYYFEDFSSYFGDDERAFLDNNNAEKLDNNHTIYQNEDQYLEESGRYFPNAW